MLKTKITGVVILSGATRGEVKVQNIASALIKAKGLFKPIAKTKNNPHFKSKYADLSDVLEAVNPGLTAAGLVVIQPTELRDGATILKTVLIHGESGEQLSTELILPSLPDPQKFGAVLTYYRRFSLCSLLAIAADDDVDGNNIATPSPSRSSVAKRSSEIAALKATHKLGDAEVKELIDNNFGKKVSEMSDTEYQQLIDLIKNLAVVQNA